MLLMWLSQGHFVVSVLGATLRRGFVTGRAAWPRSRLAACAPSGTVFPPAGAHLHCGPWDLRPLEHYGWGLGPGFCILALPVLSDLGQVSTSGYLSLLSWKMGVSQQQCFWDA